MYKNSRKSRSKSPRNWSRRSHSRSRSHSRQMKAKRRSSSNSPSRRSREHSSGKHSMKFSTSLASELYKHRKAREMRDAQIAAKLRQSVKEGIPVEKKSRVKKERTPEIIHVKSEAAHREPEFSRKERLLDARDIVVKVENIHHNHGEVYEERRVEKNESPRPVPHEPVKRESEPQETYHHETRDTEEFETHRDNDREYVNSAINNNDKRHMLLNLPLPKISPAFEDAESVSDAEPSPPRYDTRTVKQPLSNRPQFWFSRPIIA